MRREKARRAANARWDRKRLAALALGAPEREWKRVRRVTDEMVGRPRRVVELWMMDCGLGRTKTRVTVGLRIGRTGTPSMPNAGPAPGEKKKGKRST
jgi:hypothetical protein